MKRILHVIFSFQHGGAETMLVDIANQQCKDYDVHVMILNDLIEETLIAKFAPDITIHRIGRKPSSKGLLSNLKFIFKIYSIHPDVIHSHAARLIHLLKYPFAKKVYTQHCSLDIVSWNPKILNGYDTIFAISGFVKESITKREVATPVEVIYNSLDVESIEPKESYILKAPFRIIQVARLYHKIKGQDILIQALSILKKKGYSVSADFIGEGESLEYLTNIVKEYDLCNEVKFLGLKDRKYIYSHLKDYDLMCHPSLCEGFGLTVAEGMIAGLPVIVTRDDGPAEVICNGKYGYLCEKNSPESLADQIRTVIDTYPELITSIKESQKYASTKFAISNMVNQMKQFYFKR